MFSCKFVTLKNKMLENHKAPKFDINGIQMDKNDDM
jgi:hypothetical protein